MAKNRSDRAHDSLLGLALGDAFGQTWFRRRPDELFKALADRTVVPGPWNWTDDTAMAIPLVAVLERYGHVDQDALAIAFGEAYTADDGRGYGPSMHDVLAAIHAGEPWAEVTAAQFDGRGSWGNGAAMRVAPLGAWYADDLDRAAAEAAAQARVTHANPEAIAGAVAVAVAAALSAGGASAVELLAGVTAYLPPSEVRTGLTTTMGYPGDADPLHVAGTVGCGLRISAQDTVPFALWCAAHHADDLTEALWATASAGGDVDTTCAIAGGVVAAGTGLDGVAPEWLAACEALPGEHG